MSAAGWGWLEQFGDVGYGLWAWSELGEQSLQNVALGSALRLHPAGHGSIRKSIKSTVRNHRSSPVGYVRVSSVSQNTYRQLDGIAIEVIFEDHASAKTPTAHGCKPCSPTSVPGTPSLFIRWTNNDAAQHGSDVNRQPRHGSQNRSSAIRFADPMRRSIRPGASNFEARHRASTGSRCRASFNSLGQTSSASHAIIASSQFAIMVCVDLDNAYSDDSVINVVIADDHDEIVLARDRRGHVLLCDGTMNRIEDAEVVDRAVTIAQYREWSERVDWEEGPDALRYPGLYDIDENFDLGDSAPRRTHS